MNINGPTGAMNPATALVGAAVKKGHAVKRGADVEHVIHGTAGAACLGIATDDQDTAEKTVQYAHRPGERVYATAGAAFVVDKYLKSDGTGKLIGANVGDKVIAISREAAGADLDIVCVELVAPGAVYTVVGGQQLTVAAADTIATGLSVVSSVVVSLETDPADANITASAQIGDQAGAPVAGSVIIKTWKSADGVDVTPVAATAFGKKVNWIAYGLS